MWLINIIHICCLCLFKSHSCAKTLRWCTALEMLLHFRIKDALLWRGTRPRPLRKQPAWSFTPKFCQMPTRESEAEQLLSDPPHSGRNTHSQIVYPSWMMCISMLWNKYCTVKTDVKWFFHCTASLQGRGQNPPYRAMEEKKSVKDLVLFSFHGCSLSWRILSAF